MVVIKRENVPDKAGKTWVEAKSHIFARGTNIKDKTVVIDECFTGDTHIILENNKTKIIEQLYNDYVKNRELPMVKTYNETQEIFEYKSYQKYCI